MEVKKNTYHEIFYRRNISMFITKSHYWVFNMTITLFFIVTILSQLPQWTCITNQIPPLRHLAGKSKWPPFWLKLSQHWLTHRSLMMAHNSRKTLQFCFLWLIHTKSPAIQICCQHGLPGWSDVKKKVTKQHLITLPKSLHANFWCWARFSWVHTLLAHWDRMKSVYTACFLLPDTVVK